MFVHFSCVIYITDVLYTYLMPVEIGRWHLTPGLDVQMVVNLHVCAGKQTQGLCKEQQVLFNC